MSTKLFAETDWDNDVPDNKETFKYKQMKKFKKTKSTSKDEKQPEGGLYVRLKPEQKIDNNQEAVKNKKKNRKNKKSVDEIDEKINHKRKHEKTSCIEETPAKIKKNEDKVNNIPDTSKNTFADKLRDSLKGARFRYINEQLYQTKGKISAKMFKDDPSAFEAYHEGYRAQVEQWPMNPLKRMINTIRKLPKTDVIADFGCGEAILAKSVSHQVYSLDLVAVNKDVIACDMANTPLKSESVNVVVFCLSLMGTNLKEFILEANRVLKQGGKLKIAEVQSRFDNINIFIKNIESCGFKLHDKDDKSNKLFYFLNFIKTKTIEKKFHSTVSKFSLKPCLYKKR